MTADFGAMAAGIAFVLAALLGGIILLWLEVAEGLNRW